MYNLHFKRKALALLAAGLCLPVGSFGVPQDNVPDESKGPSAAILNKYLQATQTHEDVLRGVSMEVHINASIPKL